MRLFLALLIVSLSSFLTAQEIIITGLMDGTAGGTPRAIEIYVSGTLTLDGLRLERSANSNNFPDAQLELTGTYTDAFIYVVNNQTAFADAFGSAGDFANVWVDQGLLSVNGNDAFRILRVSDAMVIDQTGGEEADDDAVLYRDGYLYRNNSTGPDGGWVAANWTNELDVLDGLSLAEMGNTVPFGTFATTPAGPSVIAAANGDLAEPTTNGGFTFFLSQTAGSNVTIMYSLTGTATLGTDYTDSASGSIVIPAGQTSATLTLVTVDDNEAEFTESIELTITNVSDGTFTIGSGATIALLDDEPMATTLISQIQGSGNNSPLAGETVMVEGIVVGDFQGGDGVGLGGFFVQEEDGDADGDPLTSEGIWVFDDAGSVAVNIGDEVRVRGKVAEFQGLTKIDVTEADGQVNILSKNNTLPTVVSLDLPVVAISDYERWEGMLVTLIDPVTVTSNFGLGRFGEIEVAVGGRLIQYTECNEPDASGLATFLAQQQLGRLIVDDGRSGENTFPITILGGREVTATNSFRSGRILSGLTGIIDERFGQGGTAYRLQATSFTSAEGGERPNEAPAVGGEISVVGMNVLNYFTTLGSRGASNAGELARQQDKIVQAICALDADIIGLVEIENNGFGQGSALQTLIDAISTECGTSYAAVVVPDGNDPDNAPDTGSDQIQVALIYNSATVKESGTVATLTEPTTVFEKNRVPVTQTFQVIEEGNANMG
ncbi:MAG: ExeM/NucH family extracellular endonuclease, partial [Bacteroidota bacterium]